LNVMLPDDSKIITVLGIDREKVAAGIAIRQERILPLVAAPEGSSSTQPYDPEKALEFGYSFLEKFVQLPFRIPRASEPELEDYFDKLLGAAPVPAESPPPARADRLQPLASRPELVVTRPVSAQSPLRAKSPQTKAALAEVKRDSPRVRDMLRMVAPALDRNPRRLVQFLNLFRLQAYIAGETELFDQSGEGWEPLTLERLGKLTAISLRWSSLLPELSQYPDLMRSLEKAALDVKKPDNAAVRLLLRTSARTVVPTSTPSATT